MYAALQGHVHVVLVLFVSHKSDYSRNVTSEGKCVFIPRFYSQKPHVEYKQRFFESVSTY